MMQILLTGVLATDSSPLNFLSQSDLPTTNIAVLIALSFLAGILSFLSPCTLPLLPAYFAVTFQVDKKKIVSMSLMFFVGLAAVFMLMGGAASILGTLIKSYIASITRIGGILIIIFGFLTMFGKGFSGPHFSNTPSATFIGSFMFGATFALGWTPCIGPILSGILVLAATDKTALQGMLLLFFYALGLGIPLILISSIFSRLDRNGIFWRSLKGHGWEIKVLNKTLYLHSTSILSGVLLIILGYLLASGSLTSINSYVPLGLQKWFNQLEHSVIKIIG